ncbi:Cyclin-U3-1 [Arabidopsis thaliana]|uniref:Cyclin n=3 Tax=Arabidopsis TaxID=3701 RepID=A0A178V9J7_ARATH|nr:unknown [Arabidopsis thaliana]KAG7629512.1 Cyclin-like superfamily [Arabidopsis thaliana x Arabidopsis arenosa]KAG7635424.1 Cyclin-like superfamily [Arabidopsis suecica]KAG7629513.1 Cyclin-like superfamily [Arabidopsis thaliana x Arabidopsis arenosa]OAP02819.1 CYCP1 [Arabidopsis thaliana]
MDSLATDPAFIDSDVYLRLGLIIEGKRLKKPPTVLSRLSSSLERSLLLNHDDKILLGSPDSVTVFDGRSPPEISIAHYLDRIFKYSCCSPSCFVIAHIYIDHFLHKTRALLKPLNVHRLIITTVMLAAKVFDDRYFNNAYYARVGGVTTRELNRLEMELLFTLDFKLQVDPQTFHTHCCQLEKQNSDGFQIEWPIKEACRANKETWQKRTPDSLCSQTTAR